MPRLRSKSPNTQNSALKGSYVDDIECHLGFCQQHLHDYIEQTKQVSHLKSSGSATLETAIGHEPAGYEQLQELVCSHATSAQAAARKFTQDETQVANTLEKLKGLPGAEDITAGYDQRLKELQKRMKNLAEPPDSQ